MTDERNERDSLNFCDGLPPPGDDPLARTFLYVVRLRAMTDRVNVMLSSAESDSQEYAKC